MALFKKLGHDLSKIEHGMKVNMENYLKEAIKAAKLVGRVSADILTGGLPELIKFYKNHEKEIKDKLHKLGEHFHKSNLDKVDAVLNDPITDSPDDIALKEKKRKEEADKRTMMLIGAGVVALIIIIIIVKRSKKK
jgi:hypothetical protein